MCFPFHHRCIYFSFFFFLFCIFCLLLLLWSFFSSACTYFENNKPNLHFHHNTTQLNNNTKHDQSQPTAKIGFVYVIEKKDVYQTSKRQLFFLFFSSLTWMGCTHLVKSEFKMLCSKNSNWRLNELFGEVDVIVLLVSVFNQKIICFVFFFKKKVPFCSGNKS